MKHELIPSIIAKNQKELNLRLNKLLKYSNKFQLDVMDGLFVKNKSLNFNFKLPRKKKYEAHLMHKYPVRWIKEHSSKVSTIIVHLESEDVEAAIDLIRKKNKKAGIAINPETPISKAFPYLKKISQITILTVKPGKYGSKFIPTTLKKVSALRKMYPKLNIEVDGGIGIKNIKKAKKAGANIFISGSYLQTVNNTKDAITKLRRLIN